ncbi:MAG TPA: FAD-dependent monooxygenase [Streptosporangiaceae bacterium]|jgi:2-polyprenyl-6-methoxyphenol hydroxylase-like FAD-dependent oxidoreductase|nr:FAD-dependent monooxygenase [Streptosporangiaceae bacterium]
MASNNPTFKRVLVSGGGLAGPAIATLLARDGVDVTVIEIADGVRPGGQAVDIRGAGRSVLSRMGLLDRAREMMLRQHGIADVDSRGRRRTEMTVEDFGGEGMVSEIEILRGDLAQLLVDASVEAGASYVFATRISSLVDGPDGVDVTLIDGTELTVDLVIGADGPHSATRRLAFGPEEDFVRPAGGYMAWFTAPESATLHGWYQMFNAPGGLVASLRPGREPGVAKASLSFASGPLAYDRHDIEAQRQLLNDHFAGVGWRVPDLLRAAGGADDFYFDALVQVHMNSWTRGRIALVGDAAYCPSPLTGLGTSLALVGAYVLAGELAARPDCGLAFAGYERIMRPYVDASQKLPPGGIRAYAPQSQRAIWARWMSTRLMASRPLRGLTRRLFFSKAGAIDLPEYVPAAVRGAMTILDREPKSLGQRPG